MTSSVPSNRRSVHRFVDIAAFQAHPHDQSMSRSLGSQFSELGPTYSVSAWRQKSVVTHVFSITHPENAIACLFSLTYSDLFFVLLFSITHPDLSAFLTSFLFQLKRFARHAEHRDTVVLSARVLPNSFRILRVALQRSREFLFNPFPGIFLGSTRKGSTAEEAESVGYYRSGGSRMSRIKRAYIPPGARRGPGGQFRPTSFQLSCSCQSVMRRWRSWRGISASVFRSSSSWFPFWD